MQRSRLLRCAPAFLTPPPAPYSALPVRLPSLRPPLPRPLQVYIDLEVVATGSLDKD